MMSEPHVYSEQATVYKGRGAPQRRFTLRAAYLDAAGSRIRDKWCADCPDWERGCQVCNCVDPENTGRYGRMIGRLARLFYRLDRGKWPPRSWQR